MVLVRKRFFREHCTQLLNNDHFRRTNTLLADRTGLLSKTFTLTPKKAGPSRTVKVKRGLISGPKDVRKVENYAADRLVTELRTDHRVSEDLSPWRAGERDDVLNGSYATSTEATNETSVSKLSEPLTCHQDRSPSGLPDPHDEPRKTFDRARTVQIETPPLTTSTAYGTRQLLRARTRTISEHVPIVSERRNSLFEAATLPAPIHDPIPSPTDAQHSGFGGFQYPIHALYDNIVSPTAKANLRRRLSRVENRMTVLTNSSLPVTTTIDQRDGAIGHEESRSQAMKHATRWMPEQLNGLVVGRNSRFFSEELDDNELEQIAGVEYRALRLLGYVVGGVSLNNPIRADEAVYHPLPGHPLRRLRHLLFSNPLMG